MDVKIGQSVWLNDDNNRTYKTGQSAPVFRESFNEYTIIGENKASWLVGYKDTKDTTVYKINKKTLELRCPNRDGSWYGLSRKVFYSIREVNDACWVHDKKPDIVRLIHQCNDQGVLFRILDLLHAHNARR